MCTEMNLKKNLGTVAPLMSLLTVNELLETCLVMKWGSVIIKVQLTRFLDGVEVTGVSSRGEAGSSSSVSSSSEKSSSKPESRDGKYWYSYMS